MQSRASLYPDNRETRIRRQVLEKRAFKRVLTPNINSDLHYGSRSEN